MDRGKFISTVNPEDIPGIYEATRKPAQSIGVCPFCPNELIPESTCLECGRSRRGNRQFRCMKCRALVEAVKEYDG